MRQVVKGGYLVEESFLSSLTGIAYSSAYGVSQVIFYRWLAAPSLDADTNYMGFGQIMAMFLLVLPFFAAAECYHGTFSPIKPIWLQMLTMRRLQRESCPGHGG